MKHLVSSILMLAALLGGCVYTPTDGQSVSSQNAAIGFSGYADNANSAVNVEAFNHTTQAWELVKTLRSGSQAIDNELFAYSGNVTFARKFWVPAGSSCNTPGMARIRVQEPGGQVNPFVTFNQSGKNCIQQQLNNGTQGGIANIGYICHTGRQLVLHAPGGC